MPGSWIDHELWRAARGDLDFNPDAAIYRYWRQLRAEGTYLGVPVTAEIQTGGGIQQGFSSGAVIAWTAEGGAQLAHA